MRSSLATTTTRFDLLPALGPGRTGKFGFGWGSELGGELGRRDIADRGVRPEMIVIDPPVFDLLAGVIERQEPVRVEALLKIGGTSVLAK